MPITDDVRAYLSEFPHVAADGAAAVREDRQVLSRRDQRGRHPSCRIKAIVADVDADSFKISKGHISPFDVSQWIFVIAGRVPDRRLPSGAATLSRRHAGLCALR